MKIDVQTFTYIINNKGKIAQNFGNVQGVFGNS